jgi:hypothetical protein
MLMEQEIATVSAKVFQALLGAGGRADRHDGYDIMSDDANSFRHISSFP